MTMIKMTIIIVIIIIIIILFFEDSAQPELTEPTASVS